MMNKFIYLCLVIYISFLPVSILCSRIPKRKAMTLSSKTNNGVKIHHDRLVDSKTYIIPKKQCLRTNSAAHGKNSREASSNYLLLKNSYVQKARALNNMPIGKTPEYFSRRHEEFNSYTIGKDVSSALKDALFSWLYENRGNDVNIDTAEWHDEKRCMQNLEDLNKKYKHRSLQNFKKRLN